MNRGRKLRKSSMNKQKPKCIEVKYHQQLSAGGHSINMNKDNHQRNSSSSKLNSQQQQQHFTTFNNQHSNHNLKTSLPIPYAANSSKTKPIITTKFEREFLKKYGSDNLDDINYLPPIARRQDCDKSEIMTTVSQPVTFLNNNSRQHYRPGRNALLKSTTNQTTKGLNYEINLSNSYNQNFNSPKIQGVKARSTTLAKSYLPSSIQSSRPLLVCGPVNESSQFDDQLNYYHVKENLYEKIPCKSYKLDEDRFKEKKTIIEQHESEDDESYDNLDVCLANLNLSNKLYMHKNLIKNDDCELRNSPILNQGELRNLSTRNSPNLISSFNLTNLTDRSIKSNNSSRSIKSNVSNSSKKSTTSNQFNLSTEFNTMTNDLIEKLNFNSRPNSTSTSKVSSFMDSFNNSNVSNTSNNSSNLNSSNDREKKRNDHLFFLNRNENGQLINHRQIENLDISSSE